jgi:hypothetical protein
MGITKNKSDHIIIYMINYHENSVEQKNFCQEQI